MLKSLFGSLLNHLYHYANENVSVRHLSLICITSFLTTIYSLKNCSIYGRSCRIYSPKSFGFFRKEFRQVKKKICYLPAKGWSVWWKTVTSVLKMLHIHQDLDHSFSPYEPSGRQTDIYLFFQVITRNSQFLEKRLFPDRLKSTRPALYTSALTVVF